MFGLDVKRQQNIRVPLERIIERAGDPALQVTGATVVQAIAVYGKLNAQGQLIERRETLNLNELFERMTVQEKEAYARDGKLPEWFTEFGKEPLLPQVMKSMEDQIETLTYPQTEKDNMRYRLREAAAKHAPEFFAKVLAEIAYKIFTGGGRYNSLQYLRRLSVRP